MKPFNWSFGVCFVNLIEENAMLATMRK